MSKSLHECQEIKARADVEAGTEPCLVDLKVAAQDDFLFEPFGRYVKAVAACTCVLGLLPAERVGDVRVAQVRFQAPTWLFKE